MQKRLTLFIDGREALPVRAIPYVAGRSFLSPDEVAKQLARRVGAPFARLQNTTAFHLSGQSPINVLPKEWDEIVARFDAFESKLKRVQPSDDEGYAAWLEQATPLLPADVFVWHDEFDTDFRVARKRILDPDKRNGDDILNYSPMLSDEQRKMILEGALRYGRMHGKVCNMEKPNWREWPYIPTVMIWQSVALSMNLDPYAMARDRRFLGDDNQLVFLQNGNFESTADKEEFKLRLRILVANRDDRTHFPQRRPNRFGTSPGPFSEVALSEFAHWASSVVKWDNLPAELLAVIQKPEKQADAPAQTNDSKHELSAGDSASDTVRRKQEEEAKKDPKQVAEGLIGWYDVTLNAARWWDLTNVTPSQAAMLLCRQNPLDDTATPLITTTDETSPDDYKLLLLVFEDVAQSDSKPRTLSQWHDIARDKRLKYHSWIDEYRRAMQYAPHPENKHNADIPAAANIDAVPVTSPSSNDWISKAQAIAQEIGLKKWGTGIKQITARNISAAVAMELAKDTTTHGIQGQRGEDNVRNEGLRGWKFTPPKERDAVD